MIPALSIICGVGFIIWFPLLSTFVNELKRVDPKRFGGLSTKWGWVGPERHLLVETEENVSSSPVLFLLKGEFLSHGKRMKRIGLAMILFWLILLPAIFILQWSIISTHS